jgi:Flp pilus assembly protein CpaB
MTYRVRNIAIAIALALVAALMTVFYVSNYKRSVQQGEANVRVYVAAHDIPEGLSGADIAGRKLLVPQEVARRTVVPGAISSPDQITQLVASQEVFAGEQVSLRRFATTEQRGVKGRLTGTMRAVQVPGDPNQLLGGTLEAGDHVDLVANLSLDGSDHLTRIVLRDVDVLQVGAGTATPGRPGDSGSVLLAVRDTQVQRLFFVLKNADWTLQLRPAVDASDSPETPATTGSVVNGVVRRTR